MTIFLFSVNIKDRTFNARVDLSGSKELFSFDPLFYVLQPASFRGFGRKVGYSTLQNCKKGIWQGGAHSKVFI